MKFPPECLGTAQLASFIATFTEQADDLLFNMELDVMMIRRMTRVIADYSSPGNALECARQAQRRVIKTMAHLEQIAMWLLDTTLDRYYRLVTQWVVENLAFEKAADRL